MSVLELERDATPKGSNLPDPIPRSAAVSNSAIRLSLLTGLLGAISALVGLLWRGSGGVVTATTFLGQEVELYGRGLYRNDTTVFAANNLATDLVLLMAGLPLLVVAARLYARGSLRGHMLLLGALGFFLYYGATYALGGVAYNEMFLVYVALFSASATALLMTVLSVDRRTLSTLTSDRMPRRLLGRFMIASGLATFVIWIMEPVAALLSGRSPAGLDTHTTLFTHAFDLAIIVPAALVAGGLILQRQGWGWAMAASLLVLEVSLLPIMAVTTAIQLHLGIRFTPGEIAGPLAGFGVLSAAALFMIISTLRRIPSSVTRPGSGQAHLT